MGGRRREHGETGSLTVNKSLPRSGGGGVQGGHIADAGASHIVIIGAVLHFPCDIDVAVAALFSADTDTIVKSEGCSDPD